MGINHLRKYINKYFEQRGQLKEISSDVCYIDSTTKIYYSVDKLTSAWSKQEMTNVSILDLINAIIDKVVESLLQHINSNKFYKKFILSFDYRYITYISNRFKLSDDVYKNTIAKITDKKKLIDAIPMIPVTFVTRGEESKSTKETESGRESSKESLDISVDFETLQESVRNMYEVRYNYWKPVKKVLDYVSLEYLQEIETDPEKLLIISELIKTGYTRYILIKEAKSMCRSEYSDSIIKSKDDISKQLYDSEGDDFGIKFKEYFLKTPFSVIIAMVPNIIKRIQEKISKNISVEFIGCEDESDFAICRHIYKNYRGNCPTIYTKDTDFFLLLCKRNCILKIPYDDYNISIYTCDFWKWLLGTDDYTYLDIVALCCCFGTAFNNFRPKKLIFNSIEDIRKQKFGGKFYNYVYSFAKRISDPRVYEFLLALEIYKQSEIIENETRFIEPGEINMVLINMKFSNIYSDLLLAKHGDEMTESDSDRDNSETLSESLSEQIEFEENSENSDIIQDIIQDISATPPDTQSVLEAELTESPLKTAQVKTSPKKSKSSKNKSKKDRKLKSKKGINKHK